MPLQESQAKGCCSAIQFAEHLCWLSCTCHISWSLEGFLFSPSLVQASHLTFEAVLNVSLHKSQSSSTNLRQLFSVSDSLLALLLLRLLLVILISLLMILSLLFNVKLRGSLHTATVFVMLGPLPDAALRFIYLSHFIAFPIFQQHCQPPATTIGLTYCPSAPVPSSLHQNMVPFMLVTLSNTLNPLCPLEFFSVWF